MSYGNRPTFTFFGHSTVRCDLPSGEVVLIDPWVGQNPSCPEMLHEFDRIDAMLITHGHFDHLGDAVELAKRYRPKHVVATFDLCLWLESQDVEGCAGMNIGGTQEILGVRVSQVPALHTSGIVDGDRILYGGDPSGFVVTLPGGYAFYHAGDTALFSDMRLIAELYHPDLAFLPIGDHFTMDPRQAAIACDFLAVKQVIPIHWGTFPLLTGTPEMLEAELVGRGITCEVITLSPGEQY